MTSPSPSKGKGREMDETTPEQDKTEDNTAENKLDSILKRMQEWDKIAARNKQSLSYPRDDKAGTTHSSLSSIGATSDINYNDTNDDQLHSTTQDDKAYPDDDKDRSDLFSNDGKDVEALQPSQFREQCPDEVPSVNRRSESLINMLHSTSDYAEPEDYPSMSYESENTYSKFRQNGPDLMTRHMFSGRMNGKRPIYVPIYKRDEDGYLTRLRMNDKGHWEYVEVQKLSESESEGRLKLFVEPKTKKGHSKLEDSKRPEI